MYPAKCRTCGKEYTDFENKWSIINDLQCLSCVEDDSGE